MEISKEEEEFTKLEKAPSETKPEKTQEEVNNSQEDVEEDDGKRAKPTPESVALDRDLQNVTRMAYKNSKGDKKLFTDKIIELNNSLISLVFPL